MTVPAPPAALLLTGGASRRLGRDKASLVVGGSTLAGRTAALLVQVAAPVLEVGPGRTGLARVEERPGGRGPLAAVAAGWSALSGPGQDPPAGWSALSGPGQDPPAGWSALSGPGQDPPAGWSALSGPGQDPPAGWGGGPAPVAVLVVATDLPGLTVDLLRFVAGHPAPGCVVPVDATGRPQLLCARYPAAALARAAGLVERGARAVRDLLAGEAVTWLAPAVWEPAAGRPDALADVDTPEDLARLREWAVVGS